MNKTRPKKPITPTITIARQDAAFVRSLLLSMARDLGRDDPYSMEVRRVAGRINGVNGTAGR